MIKEIEIYITPQEAIHRNSILETIIEQGGYNREEISGIQIQKKSIDARRRNILVRIVAKLYINEKVSEIPKNILSPQTVTSKKEIYIIGAGPAGLFAALKLLELGIKPVIIERGKPVRERRRDLALITREGIVNEESNYCFGEGGAGTYSDGKLYTRSGKRGNIERILQIFPQFGADENILYEAHPHIGTNKLPHIINSIKEYIIEHGGEVRFNSKLTNITYLNNHIKSIEINNTQEIPVKGIILATGHSARDVFELLHRENIYIEAKPFALGVRAEHPQHIIDQAQYHGHLSGELLPPASYSLVDQQMGRGVFSFCMCPGGIIAPAATSPGEIVVNGWSPSKRNNYYANSGLVVSVGEEDFKPFNHLGPLAALAFQKQIEQLAFQYGGGQLQAPATRIKDFISSKVSNSLPNCSYIPGVVSAPMEAVLPTAISLRLKGALKNFAKKIHGYDTEDAIIVATESRTSSPVRIPRNPETFQHIQIKGLFPCGEGAGYAGGIVSAAMDGEKCAIACLNIFQ